MPMYLKWTNTVSSVDGVCVCVCVPVLTNERGENRWWRIETLTVPLLLVTRRDTNRCLSKLRP
jgi:hypothetical protein